MTEQKTTKMIFEVEVVPETLQGMSIHPPSRAVAQMISVLRGVEAVRHLPAYENAIRRAREVVNAAFDTSRSRLRMNGVRGGEL